MARNGRDGPSRERSRAAAWAACLATVALLLFTWPFLRSPPLGIGASYAHLLGAWTALIVALAALSRALAPPRAGSREGG